MVLLYMRSECVLAYNHLGRITLVGVLSRKLGHGICNLGPYIGNCFRGQTLQQFGTDCLSFSWLQGQEQVDRVPVLCLTRFRGLAAEDDCGE